jgi:hypothetical protein
MLQPLINFLLTFGSGVSHGFSIALYVEVLTGLQHPVWWVMFLLQREMKIFIYPGCHIFHAVAAVNGAFVCEKNLQEESFAAEHA